VRRADVATFLRCHLHAFEAFSGVPRSCLYDRTKVVVLGQGPDGPHWNTTFLDFALRVGFDARLCRPYRAQTKGRVESGIKYVGYTFWRPAQFVALADLNQQAQAWTAGIAIGSPHARVPRPEAAHHRRVRRLALRSSRGHGVLLAGLGALRAGQHSADVEQGLRRVGRGPG